MTDSQPVHHAQELFEGTVGVFLAEALVLPTGLLVAAFLTRRLGPEGYGLFVLSITLVMWMEFTIASIFSRPTIKFLGESEDWQPIATTVVRAYLLASCVGLLVLWVAAAPIARLLDEPRLAGLLRLLALDVPVYGLAHLHRDVLVGIGRFKQRALASAGRWISRLFLVVLLIQLGLSVPGALLGTIGASLVELIIARVYVRPSLFAASAFATRRLWGYAAPLFLSALAMQLFSKIDLWAVKALGGTASHAGIYGAAQNLSLVPGVFSLSFAPLLLSALSQAIGSGNIEVALKLGRSALRVVILMLPLAGMTAGAAPEIVVLVFGRVFLPAAQPLGLLIFGAVASVMIYVAAAILTGAGKPGWVLAVTWPLPLLAIGGHLFLIPRLGLVGASVVTTVLAALGALGAVVAVHRIWRVAPPAGTVARSTSICVLAYGLSAYWTTSGLLLLVKLPVVLALIVAAFALLGEFSSSEIAAARALLLRRPLAEGEPRAP